MRFVAFMQEMSIESVWIRNFIGKSCDFDDSTQRHCIKPVLASAASIPLKQGLGVADLTEGV